MDFFIAPYLNVINILFIVPPTEPVIYADGKRVTKDVIGPYNEGEPLKLLCESDGGKALLFH